MNVLAVKFGRVKLSSLIFLLICLCSSRGEGLHLLPFGGDFDIDEPSSLEECDGYLYQLSKAPERSFTVDLQPDLEPIRGFFANSATIYQYREDRTLVYIAIEFRGLEPPFALSKPKLTSVSDRSPPFVLTA